MKRYFLYIILGGLLASSLTACQQDVPSVEQTDEILSRIYLSAGIGNAVSSRTPYHPGGSEPTVSHPLNVSVWASTDDDVYLNENKNGSKGTVAIHTKAHFQSGDPQLLGEAIYPKKKEENQDAVPVYFVGLHPLSNNWETTDGTDAQFKFSGNEDVMFAPRISGTYGTDFNDSPQFHFHHLLTWLRISMVADKDEPNVLKRDEVSKAWGEIESLTITSKNQVTIHNIGKNRYKEVNGTLQIDKNEFTKEENVSFTNALPNADTNADTNADSNADTNADSNAETNADTLNLYCHNTDDKFPIGKNDDNTVPDEFKGVIPTSVTPVAYVMCAPVQGKVEDVKGNPVPEYTLHIRTTHRKMDIPLDLKGNDSAFFAGNTMGRVFNIVLNFKMGDVISVSTEISVGGDADWFTHGTGTGDLTEGDLESGDSTEDDLESNAGNN